MTPFCSVTAVDRTIEQGQYQVRFDWGRGGARAVGVDADVIVLVDVLELSSAELPAEGRAGSVVVAGSLRNRAALARWALERQADKGERFTVAVIAVGETRSDGSNRFALEDLLGAGAIIDALADVGIDYCSPEAAAAAAAFTGLTNATAHLVGASTSGRAVVVGDRAALDRATEIDASDDVPVLREFRFGS